VYARSSSSTSDSSTRGASLTASSSSRLLESLGSRGIARVRARAAPHGVRAMLRGCSVVRRDATASVRTVARSRDSEELAAVSVDDDATAREAIADTLDREHDEVEHAAEDELQDAGVIGLVHDARP